MDTPEKLAKQVTPDKEKQKHNTTCIGHHYTQPNTDGMNMIIY